MVHYGVGIKPEGNILSKVARLWWKDELDSSSSSKWNSITETGLCCCSSSSSCHFTSLQIRSIYTAKQTQEYHRHHYRDIWNTFPVYINLKHNELFSSLNNHIKLFFIQPAEWFDARLISDLIVNPCPRKPLIKHSITY